MEMRVVGRQSGWVQIANPDGSQRGWVYEKLVEPVAGANEQSAAGTEAAQSENQSQQAKGQSAGQGVGLAGRHALKPVTVFAYLIRLPRREERHSKLGREKPNSSIA
jgi:hypothetical protein